MLERIQIKNIALIESADIQFCPRLNVLSGETGSGKSVILDSLNFALGSKADKSMIRYGAAEASVRAEFYVSTDSAALAALNELDIESDGQIVITRKYNTDGRGSIKINGSSVTSGMLKSVTSHLTDVYGQSEHFTLLNESNQLKVIDGLCGTEAEHIKEEITSLIADKKDCIKQINLLGGDGAERARKMDLLSYQINEIEKAALCEGEEDALAEKQNILRNAEKIAEAVSSAYNLLYSDGGCSDNVSAAKRAMLSVSNLSSEYASICDRLEAIQAEISDISDNLSDMQDGLEFDEEEAAAVDERLTQIKNLKKKYGATIGDILSYLDNAKKEYDIISDSENAVEKLNSRIEADNDKIYDFCVNLTKLRKNCADRFCRNIENELKSLNISGARFEVNFNGYTRETANLDSKNGADNIKFMFSANKGEPLKALDKVISGGELSRFMLALKTQTSDLNGISTYVFDEIDAGISGKTANSVAEKFLTISKNTQVIAVSHLPQICAAADENFLIYKTENGASTLTNVKKLTKEEKITEIVRLTGIDGTDAARAHATELIEHYKKQ